MEAVKQLEQSYRKSALPQVQSGDTVKVHQVIREGNKQRVQIFEGVIIRTHRLGELTAVITVRRIASGVGVEKTFLLHSPNVTKVEVVRRSKVRRNFLSYLRSRRGKSARLQEVSFDRTAANVSEHKPEPKSAKAEIEHIAQTQNDPDADVTELDADNTSVEAEVSVEQAVVKDENKQAAVEDESNPTHNVDTSSENAAAAAEAESGVGLADEQDTSKGA